ncbi:hypothetical protein CTAM01_09568 [Colletotrichum tamarilloi]|uniref:Uncharacterized protein n=1 Tax=Colletotrichum tamarilloi TaxID=1209934 RepID=A0ABQ9R300_9PEZI|nr:uncharacterized protein CTAM01_09568 [Colletotrichum tamarilloi]KAI3528679.1 hypothetical protein CSPX01_16034 [Colletotrichum filicis]KAK1493160.1 hypothetical protein CTAM01_09568 [Colletotrichum tamarilloi]
MEWPAKREPRAGRAVSRRLRGSVSHSRERALRAFGRIPATKGRIDDHFSKHNFNYRNTIMAPISIPVQRVVSRVDGQNLTWKSTWEENLGPSREVGCSKQAGPLPVFFVQLEPAGVSQGGD